jgi:hypothetical protein
LTSQTERRFIMEIQFRINLGRPRWAQHWSCRRKLLLGVALALLLFPGLIVLASNLPFTDVPASGPLHDAVSAIFGAGITSGTTATTYGPNDPVTRGQMAFLLGRGLPRLAYDEGALLGIDSNYKNVAVVTLDTGGIAGRTGFVKLDGSIVAIHDSTSGCPCEVEYNVSQEGGGISSNFYATVYNKSATGVDGNVSGAITWAVSVPTASTQTFRLRMRVSAGGAMLAGTGNLTALYVPFGSTGGNTLAAEPDGNQEVTDQPAPMAQKWSKYR